MIAAWELKSTLPHFTGTGCYIRDPLTGLLYTDGIEHLADRAKANWLISDIAAIWRHHPAVKEARFLVWILIVLDGRAVLICREDTGAPILYTKEYDYTDFPVGTWKMYLVDGVLMVPSEY